MLVSSSSALLCPPLRPIDQKESSLSMMPPSVKISDAFTKVRQMVRTHLSTTSGQIQQIFAEIPFANFTAPRCASGQILGCTSA
jgi:hypothetical protein